MSGELWEAVVRKSQLRIACGALVVMVALGLAGVVLWLLEMVME